MQVFKAQMVILHGKNGTYSILVGVDTALTQKLEIFLSFLSYQAQGGRELTWDNTL